MTDNQQPAEVQDPPQPGLRFLETTVYIMGGLLVLMLVVLLGSSDAAAFSWFIGAGLAFAVHMAGSRRAAQAAGRS